VVKSSLDLAGSSTVTTADKRVLCFAETGAPDGVPVLLLHGTPGSRLVYDAWAETATTQGIRLINYDRPGYGGSTPLPGRALADTAQDVAAIAEAMGLKKLSVVGYWSGAQHALACAALLPDLVTAAVTMDSIAPYPAEGLDWFKDMWTDQYWEYTNALKGRDELKKYLESQKSAILNWDGSLLRAAYRSIQSPDADVLDDDIANFITNNFRESIKLDWAGWLDDDVAYLKPWGFDVSAISVPVLLMHAEKDIYNPLAHAKWLAGKVPYAELQTFPDEAFWGLPIHHLNDAFKWLSSKS
jgi:pimeloyl-ACP methyl ester carboxylesterase